MALQTDFTKEVYGLSMTFQDCYYRVVRIASYSKEEGCMFDVNVYRNKTMSDDNLEPVHSFGFRFPYNSNNTTALLQECYDYLKDLPEFAGAIDC